MLAEDSNKELNANGGKRDESESGVIDDVKEGKEHPLIQTIL